MSIKQNLKITYYYMFTCFAVLVGPVNSEKAFNIIQLLKILYNRHKFRKNIWNL